MLNYDPSSSANGISLCPTCHSNYNLDHDPGLVIVPEDIQYFIDHGLQDYEAREKAARVGITKERTCPSITDYLHHHVLQNKVSSSEVGGLYCRLLLKDFQPAIPPSFFSSSKPWHGAPLAIIRHAFTALGTVRIHRWPPDVMLALSQLRSLYTRPSPPVEGPTVPSEISQGRTSSSGTENQLGGYGTWPPRPYGVKIGEDIYHANQPDNWVHGPKRSSSDAMNYFAPHLVSAKENNGHLLLCST